MRVRVDFSNRSSCPRWFENPVEILITWRLEEVVTLIEAAQAAALSGRWCVGFVTYEAAAAFDPALQTLTRGSLPFAWFAIYESASVDPPFALPELKTSEWIPAISRKDYDCAVGAIRTAESNGDLYQANLTFPLRAEISGDLYSAYICLLESSQCGYGAFIETDEFAVLSLSPELFFEYNSMERSVFARPMKGTSTRGRCKEEDKELSNTLYSSPKERAENLMIVDLIRNDLGRIAVPGTVKVRELFAIERYPSVLQMTSTVSATAKPSVTLSDIFRAMFPCGSVTGAPKIASMKLISALEQSPRGIYCGSIGVIEPGGSATFSVAIRTMTVDRARGTAEYPVGGGITWESNTNHEYREALSKSAILTTAARDAEFDLIETLLLVNGEFQRRLRHVDRMLDSAHYFDFEINRDEIEMMLEVCSAHYPSGSHRIRLCSTRHGKIRYEQEEYRPLYGPHSFAVSETPVSSSNRFLFHKTSHRHVYEGARMSDPNVWEVLLTNERGELTEFTRGNLVIECNKGLFTPPRMCGLLAGIMRQELIDSGELQEKVLFRDDLETAERIWFINSLRGKIEMRRA